MKIGILLCLLFHSSLFVIYSQNTKFEADGDRAFESNDFEKAISYYSSSLETDISDDYTYFLRGLAKYNKEDYLGSILDFTKSIQLTNEVDRTDFWSYNERYSKIGNNYVLSKNGSSLQFRYFHIYFYRGQAKYFLEDYRGAIVDFDNFISYDNQESSVYILRGICNFNLNSFINSINDFTKAIEIDTQSATSYYYRGISYLNIDQVDNGCLDLSRAGELGQEDAYRLIKEACKK